jgi:amidase
MKVTHLYLIAALAASLPAAHAATFDLSTATIADIQAAMDSGSLTSEKLVKLYLARIEAYDKNGPKVNAVITLNPNALEEARALDAERKAKGPRSPLHGTTVVLKDLIDAVGMPTTAGFTPFGAPMPLRDATIVGRLKDAGVIVLAKVSTTNWFGQGFDETHPIGVSLNPYNLEHTAGGSSNGSGVAIAANFSTFAIGTDTSVSVQSPSANNSVTGMVGTYGTVSRAGIVPRGATQDRPGPMARSVADVARVFSVISGWDAEDLTTFNAIGHFPQEDLSTLLKNGSLAGRRIGIFQEMIPSHPAYVEGVAIFNQAVEDLRKAGAYVVPIQLGLPSLSVDTAQPRLRTAEYEKIAYTDAYLARLGPNAIYRTTREMMDKVGHDKFTESMRVALDLPPPHQSADYAARYRARQMYIKLISEAMDRYALDVIVQPFTALPPGRLDQQRRPRDPEDTFGANNLSSSLGLPAVIVPGGYTPELNLPIGIQFMGRPFSETTVLQIAHGYEKASQRWRPAPTTPPLPGERFEY